MITVRAQKQGFPAEPTSAPGSYRLSTIAHSRPYVPMDLPRGFRAAGIDAIPMITISGTKVGSADPRLRVCAA
jgi:hypothetical protein